MNDPRWKDDPGVQSWKAFTEKYMSLTEFPDANAEEGFNAAGTMVQVLKQCGNDLSRDNIMKQAANLKDLELPLLLPGVKINTSPHKLQPDPPDAARDIQRRKLGAVRRDSGGLKGAARASMGRKKI